MDEQQMIDIELPLAPGVDWWFWIQSFGAVLMLLIVIGAFLWLTIRFWRPLRVFFAIRRLNKKGSKNLPDTDALALAIAQAFTLLQVAKRHHLLETEQLNLLQAQMDPMCFSTQTVSHETFQTWLFAFERLIRQRYRFKKIWAEGLKKITQAKRVNTIRNWLAPKGANHG